MRMLIILSGLHMGGIERMLLSSIPFYNLKGFNDIHILSTSGGQLENEFKDLNVIIHKYKGNANPLLQLLKVRELHRKYKYTFINSNFGHTSGFLSLSMKFTNAYFVVSVHNQKAMFKTGWEKKFMLGSVRSAYLSLHKYLTVKFSNLIIGHSKTNLRYFSHEWEGDSKYFAVKNGVDFADFNKIPSPMPAKMERFDTFVKDSKFTFIHIGSFKEQKNHIFLLKLFKKLNPQVSNYKLVLLGAGGDLVATQKFCKEIGIENEVLFLGIDMDVSYYLGKANAFIFPSIYEGFGNVLIEAQYKRLPILASRILPHYESVAPCYHNYFYSPVDESEALEKCMEFVEDCNTPEMQFKIAEGFNFASTHTIENMTFDIADRLKDLSKT